MAPAVANNVTVGTQSSSAITSFASPSFASTTGNAIVVMTQWYTGTPTGVTDTAGNTYTQVSGASATGSTHQWDVRVAQNIVGNSANVVTVGASPGLTYCSVHVYEVSGVATSAAVDAAVSGSGYTSPGFSTAQASEIILIGGAENGNDAAITGLSVGGVAATLGTYCKENGTSINTQTGYLVVSTAQSGVTGSFSPGAADGGITVLSLKGAAAAAVLPPRPITSQAAMFRSMYR